MMDGGFINTIRRNQKQQCLSFTKQKLVSGFEEIKKMGLFFQWIVYLAEQSDDLDSTYRLNNGHLIVYIPQNTMGSLWGTQIPRWDDRYFPHMYDIHLMKSYLYLVKSIKHLIIPITN